MRPKRPDSNQGKGSTPDEAGEGSNTESLEHGVAAGGSGSTLVPASESGIDLLRRFDPRPELRAADRLTWTRWYEFDELLLYQLVALHSYLDPESLGDITDGVIEAFTTVPGAMEADPTTKYNRFRNNLNTAAAAVERGELKCVEIATDLWYSPIRVAAFQAWSRAVRLPVVEAWPGWTGQPSAASSVWENPQDGRWPWGDHTTPTLEWLAKTANAMWKLVDQGGRYDPADNRTAPTNDQVADWLAGEWPESSSRCRQFIATMLRPPDLPTGRRTPRARRSQ